MKTELSKTSVSWKEWRKYVGSVFQQTYSEIGVASLGRSIAGAALGLLVQWLAGMRDRQSTWVLFLITAGSALAVLTVEVIFKLLRAPAKINRQQQEAITKLNEASAVKLFIERVTCQRPIDGDYDCRVTIRNLSENTVADNVSVRLSGRDITGLYREGYNPFHECDLLPCAGTNRINPGASADFVFPPLFNQLITVLGHRIYCRTIKLPPQTFKLTISSSSCPSFPEEFVMVENDKSQMSIVKNIIFDVQGCPTERKASETSPQKFAIKIGSAQKETPVPKVTESSQVPGKKTTTVLA